TWRRTAHRGRSRAVAGGRGRRRLRTVNGSRRCSRPWRRRATAWTIWSPHSTGTTATSSAAGRSPPGGVSDWRSAPGPCWRAPGEYPFTRGIHPTMYGGRLWTMRQFAGFGTAEDTNQRYKFLLEHGQTGLSVAFDFPTLMGYDSDHPRAEGEVGKCGVAISSL